MTGLTVFVPGIPQGQGAITTYGRGRSVTWPRRSTPKGALRYATEVLTGRDQRGLISRWFSGMPNQAETEVREALRITTGPPASDARLPLAILAQVAGAIESGMHPQSWRNPDHTDAAWLSSLQSQGYELAEIEQHIIDTAPDPRQAIDDDPAQDEEPTP